MTELEMTRLAAKAIGKEFMTSCSGDRVFVRGSLSFGPLGEIWTPRTNSAQAFELLEKLQMLCMTNIKHKWVCRLNGGHAENADLKRAIVECAANYQLEKEKQA